MVNKDEYIAQVDWLGPKVGGAACMLFCIYCVNRVNSRNAMTTAP